MSKPKLSFNSSPESVQRQNTLAQIYSDETNMGKRKSSFDSLPEPVQSQNTLT